MDIPLLAGAYAGISPDTSSQEAINFFFEKPAPREIHGGAMLPVHGVSLFATMPNAGIIRGMYYNADDTLLYVISGNKFYEVTIGAAITERGTLTTSSGFVQTAFNVFSNQLLIIDGTNGYIFNTATNTFTQLSTANFADNATTCAYKDGYFLINTPGINPGRFRWSELNDGLTWPATNFATAESLDSTIIHILTDKTNVYIWGANNGEIWYNSGDPDFTFQRFEYLNSGAVGISLIGLPCQIFANGIAWIQRDRRGILQAVVAGPQYQPQVFSTPEIEGKWTRFSSYTAIFTYVYQIDGHEFFVVTFTGGVGDDNSPTYVFDAQTKEWHQRSGPFNSGAPTREPVNAYAFCHWTLGFNAGTHIVGDYQANGNLYRIRPDLYTWNGVAMERRATGAQIEDQNSARFSFSELEVRVNEEVSSGDVVFSWSKDGGQTYTTGRTLSLGNTRIMARKPGYARSWIFRLYTDTTDKIIIRGAYGRVSGEPLRGSPAQPK